MLRVSIRVNTRILAAVAIIVYLAAVSTFAQESTAWSQNVSPLPSPTGMVNDFAGVIDETTKRQLEMRLSEFKKKDRKSTRLNSSHLVISYAVFCLKKKIQ